MQSKHSVALDRIKTRWCPRLSNKSAIIGCLAASGHRVSHSEPITSPSSEPISECGVGQVTLQRHVGGHSGSLLPGTVLCCTVGWCQYWIFPVKCCLILILNSNKFSLLWGEAQLSKIKRPGGGWRVATNFNVSSRQGFKLWGLSPWLPSLADPCLTLAWASQYPYCIHYAVLGLHYILHYILYSCMVISDQTFTYHLRNFTRKKNL